MLMRTVRGPAELVVSTLGKLRLLLTYRSPLAPYIYIERERVSRKS